MPKTNKYAFVIYEESNPLDKVLGFLTINHYAAAVSPLHVDTWTEEDVERWRQSQTKLHGVCIPQGADKWRRPTGRKVRDGYGCMVDEYEELDCPKVGDEKKAHRHVYLELDYSAPVDTVLKQLAPLDICYVEVVRSRRGYLRYLCHLDNPEKRRYRVQDVIQLGGVDLSCLWVQDEAERYEQDGMIYKVIRENRIHSIHELIRWLTENEKRQMYNEVKSHYGYWVQYLRGAYYVNDTHISEVPEDWDEQQPDEVAEGAVAA